LAGPAVGRRGQPAAAGAPLAAAAPLPGGAAAGPPPAGPVGRAGRARGVGGGGGGPPAERARQPAGRREGGGADGAGAGALGGAGGGVGDAPAGRAVGRRGRPAAAGDLLDAGDQLLGGVALGHLLADLLDLAGLERVVEVGEEGPQGQAHGNTPFGREGEESSADNSGAAGGFSCRSFAGGPLAASHRTQPRS